jgi:hypothetical protein
MSSKRVLMATARANQNGFAISSTYASGDLGAAPNSGANAVAYVPVPDDFTLDHLEVQLQGMASSPTTITMFLAWDSSGDYAATNEATADIKVGKTTATKGTAYFVLNRHIVVPPEVATRGHLYCFIKTNTGTANAVVRAYGVR